MPVRHGAAVELRHLRYFVAVAEEGSFTNAAATGAEMMMLVDHFERAASDAGQSLATKTQQTLEAARSLADKLTHGGTVVPADVEASLAAMDKEVHSLMTKTAKLKT